MKVLNGLDCISMKLIDYGDIVSIKFSNLAQLLPCFRNLPKQAIKAELAGKYLIASVVNMLSNFT